jgi:hypothetical protein
MEWGNRTGDQGDEVFVFLNSADLVEVAESSGRVDSVDETGSRRCEDLIDARVAHRSESVDENARKAIFKGGFSGVQKWLFGAEKWLFGGSKVAFRRFFYVSG